MTLDQTGESGFIPRTQRCKYLLIGRFVCACVGRAHTTPILLMPDDTNGVDYDCQPLGQAQPPTG